MQEINAFVTKTRPLRRRPVSVSTMAMVKALCSCEIRTLNSIHHLKKTIDERFSSLFQALR